MLLSLVAIAILIGSTLLILSNLKMVLQDIYDVVVHAVAGARFSDHLAANLALIALWLVVFVVSFG